MPCIHPRQYLSLHVGKKQKRKIGCILPYLRYEMPRHIANATDASEDDKRPHAPQGEPHLEEARDIKPLVASRFEQFSPEFLGVITK